MFTGLIQRLGRVLANTPDGHGGQRLILDAGRWTPQLGESVAVDGVCLTLAGIEANRLVFDVGPETVHKTTLGGLVPGQHVNLEPALRVGDPLGGHFVSGHVDAVGTIAARHKEGQWQTVWFSYPAVLQPLLAVKGSVAVDGVSLTVVEVESDRFSVMLIPHTLQATTLGRKQIGDRVNLEADLIARHVQRLFSCLTIEI